MNILILTAYAPVLHMHGGGVRMYHNIRILAEKHSVRVISFVESDEERESLRALETMCESVTAVRRVPDFKPHWFSLLPFLVREFSTPEMYRAVETAFSDKRVDVLQCEYLQMAQFWRRPVFTILTAHEALSANAREMVRRKADYIGKLRLFYRWMQVMRYEVLQSRRFSRVVTMTQHDADYLRSYSPKADIRNIPIGIDPEEFAPARETPQRPLEVLFVGNFRHDPNVEAAEFLVKRIAPLFPDVQFTIPGSHVPDHLRGARNVTFPGYVVDTRVLYKRPNTIVVAPLFSGTGQRVKLLEAFSTACAVVTTSIGALGYPIKNGHEAIVADTVDDFAAGLRRLAASVDLRRSMGMKAREMIMREFTWDRIGEQFLEIVEESRGFRP